MRSQTKKEEFFNVITHGVGFLLSLVGFALLFIFHTYETWQGILGLSLYGVSLALLYFSSTIYHYEKNVNRKIIYRKLDHISIYLLIAGTYSPVVLVLLNDSLGWILFWSVWTIALLGTILKIFFTCKFEVFSTLLYLAMGWLIVFDFSALKESVDQTGLYLLMGGGAAYTIGIVFYALEKMKFNHVIWHVFVLTGSILHYLFIFLKVL